MKELNAERTRLIQERQAEYAEYRKVRADRTEFIRANGDTDDLSLQDIPVHYSGDPIDTGRHSRSTGTIFLS